MLDTPPGDIHPEDEVDVYLQSGEFATERVKDLDWHRHGDLDPILAYKPLSKMPSDLDESTFTLFTQALAHTRKEPSPTLHEEELILAVGVLLGNCAPAAAAAVAVLFEQVAGRKLGHEFIPDA